MQSVQNVYSTRRAAARPTGLPVSGLAAAYISLLASGLQDE